MISMISPRTLGSSSSEQMGYAALETGPRPAPADTAAFDDVVENYSGFAYNVAFRMLRNSQDAEDAVQEAFISAFKSFSTFKGQSKVSTWLYRIVVNVCLMKIRKDKTRAKYLSDTALEDNDLRDWTNDPQLAAEGSELRGALNEGLQHLPPELRAPVVLRDVQGFSNMESAEILEVTVPSFKSRLHRGRVLLREHLAEYIAAQSA